MTARAVVTGRWYAGDRHAPLLRSIAFVITDDPGHVGWGEQVRRIAALMPARAQWEVIPVPADVSAHDALNGTPS